jgi:hypothetical protein
MILDMLNTARLARRLAANDVEGLDAAVFLAAGNILYVIFSYIGGYVLGFGSSRYIEGPTVEAILAILITGFGVRACYCAYSGTNFMQAFIVLSVPALVYSTALTWTTHFASRYLVAWYVQSASFSEATSAHAAAGWANEALEVGAVAAGTVGLLSFYYFVRLGLKMAKPRQ